MIERVDLLTPFTAELKSAEVYAMSILRPQLRQIFKKSEETVRFTGIGFPNLDDNVYIHSLRLVYSIDQLPITKQLKQRAKFGAVLHDIPETELLQRTTKPGDVIADITATAKSKDALLDIKTELVEEIVAQEILTPDEFKLFQEVAQASAFLKGRDPSIPTATGLIVRMSDKIDSDIMFHFLAKDAGPKADLSTKGQGLVFEQYDQCSERLNSLKETEIAETAQLCQQLLDQCMQEIENIWQNADYIPPVILENLQKRAS